MNSRYISLVSLVLALFLLPVCFSYVEYGGALYCDSCSDCTDALNASGFDIVYLNASSLFSPGATCINYPINFTNKAFDCQGNEIYGDDTDWMSGVGAGQTNATTQNCVIHDFYYCVNVGNDAHVLNNTISSCDYSGIGSSYSSNIAVIGNNISSSFILIYLINVDDSSIINNSLSDSLGWGGALTLQDCQRANVTGNTYYDYLGGGPSGFWAQYGGNHTFVDNIAKASASDPGFDISNSGDNYIFNCTAYSSIIGFREQNGKNNRFFNDTAYNNSYGFLSTGKNSTFINDSSFNNEYGFVFDAYGTNVTVFNNTIYNNSIDGIEATDGSTSTLFNISICDNLIYGNGAAGIQFLGVENSTISGNRVENNTYGISIEYYTYPGSYQDVVDDNFVSGNSLYGLYLQNAKTISISNLVSQENGRFDVYLDASSTLYCTNTMENITGSGGRGINYTYSPVTWDGQEFSELILCNAGGSIISDSLVEGSSTLRNNGVLLIRTTGAQLSGIESTGNYVGISLSYSSTNLFTDAALTGNQYGILIGPGSYVNNFSSPVLYDNDYSLYVNSSVSSSYLISNSSFRNSSGGLNSSANLSISDSLEGTSAYSINWSSTPDPLPENTLSFAQKSIEIATYQGAVSISSVLWNWAGANLSGYDESRFEVWEQSSGIWELLNDTPDLAEQTLGVYALVPASIYSILEDTSIPPEPSGEDGGNRFRTECNSDSDCTACEYCSIANKKCLLKETSQCMNDSGCSALGAGYTCGNCTCVPPECTTNSDCAAGHTCVNYECILPECTDDSYCQSGYECKNYRCIEKEPELPTEEGEPQEGGTPTNVTPTEEEPSQPGSSIIPVEVPTVENPQQETPETNVISGQLLLWVGLIILLVAIAAIYFLKKKTEHKKRKKEES